MVGFAGRRTSCGPEPASCVKSVWISAILSRMEKTRTTAARRPDSGGWRGRPDSRSSILPLAFLCLGSRSFRTFLGELDITKGRSTGIPKILRAMKKNGSRPPEFEFDRILGTHACRRALGQLEIDPGTLIPWAKLASCGQDALVAFARTQGAIGDRG